MKKTSIFTATFLIAILLMGCGANRANEDVDKTTTNEPTNEVVEKDTEVTEEVRDDVTPGENNVSRLEIAEEAADKVTELDEVDSATVIVTNRNAYVAAMLRGEVTEDSADVVEEKIAEQVRSTDSRIDNVYVSTNPDFVERMRGYGTKINAGEPVEGFFEEFTESVRRVFPDAE